MRPRIMILLDYRGFFYGSTVNRMWSFDPAKTREELEGYGFDVDVRGFPDVDFRSHNYRGVFVLYQSSEDDHLLYKSYIEDVLLGLESCGAILVPPFRFFRAHHNKVFMEILRDLNPLEHVRSLRAWSFGTLEDARAAVDSLPLPAVIKPAAGACSTQVQLARNRRELLACMERASRSASPWRRLRRRLASTACRWMGVERSPRTSLHRCKFVVQEFLPDLANDYKVLVYGDRYYFVRRENRLHDFRASGSGRISRPGDPPPGMLDFADAVYRAAAVPFISMDLAFAGGRWHLIEVQFVMFGNLTIEGADRYFVKEAGLWTAKAGRTSVEAAFARALALHLSAGGNPSPWVPETGCAAGPAHDLGIAGSPT